MEQNPAPSGDHGERSPAQQCDEPLGFLGLAARSAIARFMRDIRERQRSEKAMADLAASLEIRWSS